MSQAILLDVDGQVVDDHKLADEAHALVAHLATQPSSGLAMILEEQLTLERDLQRQAGRSDDYREGVVAFMAKRKPDFKER